MNSALAAVIGLLLSIVLIIKKVSPVFSLMLGAIVGGLLAGWGLETTVTHMIGGVKDITPAIVRILAAGVLTGMLVKTGAATTIAKSIIKALGEKYIYLALAISAMILTGMGVFIDVAVITIAPIAIIMGCRLHLSKFKLLLAMIGGGKCGNILSPNPNTIIAAENFDAPLSSVMAAGIVPALIGLIVTVFVIVPLIPKGDLMGEEAKGEKAPHDTSAVGDPEEAKGEEALPTLWRSLLGPVVTIILLALRPIAGIVIDPMIALPVGGVVGIIATGKWRETAACLTYGLEKMSGIAILLVGTGTLAGIIKASAIKDVLVGMLAGWSNGGTFMAPIAGALMSAATASTTAGATIASASFGEAILAAGVTAVWGAAMTNAGATTLDHLPHGSFFHATGGSMGFSVNERLRLIPYETLVGLILTLGSIGMYFIVG